MKNLLKLLVLSATLLILHSTNALAVTIPLNTDSWNLEQPWGGSATMLEETDGIKFTGSYTRGRTRIKSDFHGDFRDSVIDIQWMANGGIYNDYGSFWLGAGYLYSHPTYGELASLPASQGSMTTHHSWAGSTIIASNTWYYTSIIITPDQHVETYTTTGGYYDTGGSAFYSKSYDISDTAWAFMEDTYIIAGFNDNYGGTNTWMKLGEVSYSTNNPVPEPSTLFLLVLGLAGFAGIRRKIVAK